MHAAARVGVRDHIHPGGSCDCVEAMRCDREGLWEGWEGTIRPHPHGAVGARGRDYWVREREVVSMWSLVVWYWYDIPLLILFSGWWDGIGMN